MKIILALAITCSLAVWVSAQSCEDVQVTATCDDFWSAWAAFCNVGTATGRGLDAVEFDDTAINANEEAEVRDLGDHTLAVCEGLTMLYYHTCGLLTATG